MKKENNNQRAKIWIFVGVLGILEIQTHFLSLALSVFGVIGKTAGTMFGGFSLVALLIGWYLWGKEAKTKKTAPNIQEETNSTKTLSKIWQRTKEKQAVILKWTFKVIKWLGVICMVAILFYKFMVIPDMARKSCDPQARQNAGKSAPKFGDTFKTFEDRYDFYYTSCMRQHGL